MAIYDSNGQILVKPGDSISKYHLAIFGNFGNPIAWSVFARPPDPPGKIPKTITNYDLIFAGETLLYVPEWKKKHPPGYVIPVRGSGPLTPDEFDMLIRRLNFEAGLSANLAQKYAYKYIKFIDDGNSAVGGVEAIDAAVRYMKVAMNLVGNVMTVVNGAPSFPGIAFFQLGGFLAWINARKQGIRYVTLRAAAYGLTSWTYGDPPPAYPSRMRDNLPKGPVTDPMLTVRDFTAEWDITVARVRQVMDSFAREKYAGKPCIQTSLAFTASGPKELCKQAMTALESKYLSSMALPFLPPFVLESVHLAFFSPEPDYPN